MSGRTIGGIVGAAAGFILTGGNPAGARWGFTIGSTLGGIVKPDKIKGPTLDDASRPTAAEGVPIPWGYGTYPVAGHLIWAGDVQEHEKKEGGKGGPQQISYTYTRPYAIAFGAGEATGISALTRNGKLVYDIRPGSTILGQNAKFLAGCTIYLGSETQLVDPTIEAAEGVGATSPYRGTIYIVLEDDTTQAGEVAQWEAIVQKCGTVTDLTYPDEPTLIVGTAYEYKGYPATLSAISGYAPPVHSQYTNSSSVDGIVIAGRFNSSNDIAIYRWNGSAYVAMTITGATPGIGAQSIYATACSDNAEWVVVSSHINEEIFVYQYDGAGYTLRQQQALGRFPRDIVFSPDCTKIAFTNNSPFAAAIWRYDFNTGTGALTNFATSGDVANGYNFIDWVGNQLLVSQGSTPRVSVYDAGTMALVCSSAETVNSDKAYWSADGNYAYWPDGSAARIVAAEFTGSALTTMNTYSLTGTGPAPGGSAITKARDYILVARGTGASNFFQINGATLTQVSTTLAPLGGSGFFTGLGPRREWYDVPDAPGTYADEDGVLQTQYVVGTEISSCGTTYGAIVADLCDRSGVDSTEYDVTQLTGFVKGFKCAAGSSADAYIEALANAGFFDRGEWDKKVRFINRGGASVGGLTVADLVRRDGPAIEWTEVNESELLRKVSVLTLNPDTNFTTGKQTWERRVSTIQAKGESTIELPLVASADLTAQIAAIKGKIAWTETAKAAFGLSLKHSKYTPTDVLTLTDDESVAHRIRFTSGYEENNVFTVEEATRDRAEAYESNAVGTVTTQPGVSTPGLIGHTLFAAMALPMLRSSDNSPGFYVGACGMLAGWTGCQVLMSVDGGLSYQTALTITEPTTMGTLTADCTTSSEPIAVRVFGNLESASFLQVGLGKNWAAIASVGGTPEIIAYETATSTGTRTYDLTDTYRGRDETVAAAHVAGEQFMDLATAYFLPIPQAYAGGDILFKAVGLGVSADAVDPVTVPFEGRTYVYDGGEVTP